MDKKKKIIRIAAVAGSLGILLKGQLNFLSSYYDVIGVASDEKELKKIGERENIRVKTIRIDRQINIIVDLISLVKLYFLFKKEKPYIVHSITPKAGLVSMLAAYFAGVPHRLHTFTGLIFPTRTGISQKILIFFDKIICFCATNIYPEGKGVKEDLIQFKITKKELKILANGNVNGIDVSHFDPNLYPQKDIDKIKNEIGILPSDFVFLFVGRIVVDKGIHELIAAFTAIDKNHKNVKLLLVGPFERDIDPIEPEVEIEIDQNPNIISMGWQNDVRSFFAVSNVFVFPSYREGHPNVVIQNGSMGKFSIVTDINGSNEIIEPNKNGTIIPVKDTKALTLEMENCLKNRVLFETPNASYRKMISEKFDHKIVWDAILNEYQSLGK